MTIYLRVLGWTIFDFTITFGGNDQQDAETDAVGAQGGTFERDTTPLSPDDRYHWNWEEARRFGFGR